MASLDKAAKSQASAIFLSVFLSTMTLQCQSCSKDSHLSATVLPVSLLLKTPSFLLFAYKKHSGKNDYIYLSTLQRFLTGHTGPKYFHQNLFYLVNCVINLFFNSLLHLPSQTGPQNPAINWLKIPDFALSKK